MPDPRNIDIREDDLLSMSPGLLSALLKDHTLSTDEHRLRVRPNNFLNRYDRGLKKKAYLCT